MHGCETAAFEVAIGRLPGVRECARRAAAACQLVAGVLIVVIVRPMAEATWTAKRSSILPRGSDGRVRAVVWGAVVMGLNGGVEPVGVGVGRLRP